MNIVLVGFRGTGKTTVGKSLAKRLGMKFVDLDRQIVRMTGKPVPEIFAESGEKGFRELEKKAVADVSMQDNLCIACGGGVVLSVENVDSLKRNSTIILLEAEPKVIYRRIRRDRNRPSLTGNDLMSEIRELLAERKALYDSAVQMRFDTSVDQVHETVQKIIDALNEAGKV